MVETISVGSSVAAYSHAKVVGGLIFTSGVTSHDLETGEVRGTTIEEQTELAIDLLRKILEKAGAGLADLVQVKVYLNDITTDFAGFDAVYRRLIPAPFPPRATVGATLPGYHIEMMAIAAVPES
ncbi:RidA family protein [Pseudoclavibacter sp. CFCC 13796]|uniref:RidA family protein n=1 Tax=Pseudoclavibacter sp. CFCC 13796 TaxID=2615179 RepID=UPI0017886279|nr:RidA family protein [Pseudoclavibacter sp. CFCC 13796]